MTGTATEGQVKRYGWWYEPSDDLASIELHCLRAGSRNPEMGAYHHCRMAIDRIWNDYYPETVIWNDWSEWMVRSFCENRWVVITGPAASWKTTMAAVYVLTRWYSSPQDTVVICTSTTLDGLRRRIWKEISKFYRLRPAFGNPVQSRNCIQWEKGIDEAGIYGLATDKGEIEKAIGKIQGFHAPNVIVVADELTVIPEAIVEACVNLDTGVRSFQFIGLGNATDHLDPHGRMCEPVGGWDSIDESHESWETRRGICLHLDGLKSPSIRDGKLYPGLISQKDIDTTAQIYGIDSPQFWQMRRGFWAPEGVQKTVLTMPMIEKGGCKLEPSFDAGFTLGAGLDPAFEGGDRCVLRFGKCGAQSGQKVLGLNEIVNIKTKALPGGDDPVHYQVVRQVREECVKRGVEPHLLGIDSTGEGGGLLSIFHREWSPEVLGIEFGGRPSRKAVSQTNPKRADQEYDRRVTELWFFLRLLVQGKQLYGLDSETATEFCRRWYEMKGALISLETKKKMKERTRKSPDLADAVVVLAQMFVVRGYLGLEKVTLPDGSGETLWGRFQKKRGRIESVYEQATA